MKRQMIWVCLAVLAAAGLMGSGPCNQGGLSESNHPLDHFYQRMLSPGDAVNIYEKVVYYSGEYLDPNSVSNLTVKVQRVSDNSPVPGEVTGFDFYPCGSINYALILEIFSWVDWDLSATAGFVNLRSGGQDYRIPMPNTVIPAGQALALYIASDGSAYYAIDDSANSNPHTHDMFDPLASCDYAGGGCPSLTPAQAFAPAYLAAAASGSPSAEPLLLHGDTIDPTDGLNGGLIADVTADQRVYVIGIEAFTPYYGYDQLNSTDFLLGGYESGPGYAGYDPGYLQSWAPDCPRGIVFTPFNLGVACDLDPSTDFQFVLDGVFLKDGTAIPLLTIPFSTNPLPAGYPPNYCLP